MDGHAGHTTVPTALPVAGRQVLVVGHGRAAWRCSRRLLAAGAVVTVASPTGAWGPGARRHAAGHARHAAQSPDDRLHVVRSPAGAPAWAGLLASTWLVHLATPDRALSEEVARSCATRRLWCLPEPAAEGDDAGRPGSITLVGGGPGDPELITVAGRRALAEADVVLVDRLAPREGLTALAPAALVLDVGKSPGHHCVPQDRIEAEMLAHARAGARVVRLKGGDPYVFGRGREEVQAALDAGIVVRVVPGVSSAVAAPAAAGIPLTHRGVSHSFTVVSAHDPLGEAELGHLAGLAGAGGTVVVLMGVATLPHLAAGLARRGLDPVTPCAVVERACGPSQRTTLSTLGELVVDAGRAGVRSPAVIVVGDVVRLADGAVVAGLAGVAGAPVGTGATDAAVPGPRRESVGAGQ